MDQSFPTQKIFLDERDLQLALVSACAAMGAASLDAHARFYHYSSLKATASMKANRVLLKASEGFKSAPPEALLGLCVYLLEKLLRRKAPALKKYVDAYNEFVSSEGGHKLNSSLRVLRARERNGSPKGAVYDLNEILSRIAAQHWNIFTQAKELPTPMWSSGASKRVLGEYDDAFNTITVSSALDHPRVPEFIVEYVVFHELLHAKHDPHYLRGESKRRTVHTREFKLDEKKFPLYEEADQWLARNLRRLKLRIS